MKTSGATALAGLLALARSGVDHGDDVCVILSGGDVDRHRVPFGP